MQKDLFGGVVASTVLPSEPQSKRDFLQKYKITLRLDQMIIGVLLFVVAYVLVFSFGVESGKRYAMAEIKAERAMRERMARELGEKIFANAQQQNHIQGNVVGSNHAPVLKEASQSTAVREPNIVENPTLSKGGGLIKKDALLGAAKSLQGDAVSSQSGKFSIQTIAFNSKIPAQKFLEKLSAKGYQGKIVTKGKLHQVALIGFQTKEQAAKSLIQLKSLGLAPKDAYIKPLPA